jgi:hypothetical protein
MQGVEELQDAPAVSTVPDVLVTWKSVNCEAVLTPPPPDPQAEPESPNPLEVHWAQCPLVPRTLDGVATPPDTEIASNPVVSAPTFTAFTGELLAPATK